MGERAILSRRERFDTQILEFWKSTRPARRRWPIPTACEVLGGVLASRRWHAQACSEWDESMQPAWLTSKVFSLRIQPLLAEIPTSVIRSQIGVSRWYAGQIRRG